MVEHIGNRVKYLVENNFKGTKKEFAKAIGLKQETYLFEIFNKEDLGTDLLKRMAIVLNLRLADFLAESSGEINVTNEPPSSYMKRNSDFECQLLRERVKDLEKINLLQEERYQFLIKKKQAKA